MIIALALILSCVGCGTEEPEQETNVTTMTEQNGAAETEPEETEIVSRMEEKDYDGYEYRILTTTPQMNNVYYHEVFSEGENGETVNDAVFTRNIALEEKYNVKVSGIHTGLFDYSTFEKSVPAGEDLYDVVMANQSSSLQYSVEGYLQGLNNIENLCLEEPWWQQTYNSQVTIRNKLFFAISDANLASFESVPVLFFNKQMVADLALEEPYQIVKDGEWTFDALLEYCQLVSQDLNGDGIYYDEDMYGLLVNSYAALTFMYGGGAAFSQKDAEDVPHYTYDEDFVTYFQKMVTSLTNNNTVMYGEKMSHRTQSMQLAFKEDRGLFYNEMLTYANNLRDMETDFGIVPMPKRDMTQEFYTGFYHMDSSSTTAIPVTVTDLERTSRLTEDLAFYSMLYVYPAYIENTVKTKSARDEYSAEMVDIALEKISCDILFSMDVTNNLRQLFTKESTDVVSSLEAIRTAQETKLQKYADIYAELGE